MRAKRVVLVGGLLLATVLGVAGGYYVGEVTKAPYPVAGGVPAPLGGVTASPPEGPLPVKTGKPNPAPALTPDSLDFHTLDIVIDLVENDQGIDPPPVKLSVRVPIGWKQSVTEKGEAKFTDPRRVRWIRIATVYPIKQTAKQKRDQLVPTLDSSIAHEDAFQLIGQSDDAPTGPDDRKRRVSTVTYSYIPDQWVRPVIVQYVTTADSPGADFEMSITGLKQDQKGLDRVAEVAANSVLPN